MINRNRPWDKRDPSLGQIGTHPWDKPAISCLIPQSNRHFVPFVPGTGGGSENVYVFSVYSLFAPIQKSEDWLSVEGGKCSISLSITHRVHDSFMSLS